MMRSDPRCPGVVPDANVGRDRDTRLRTTGEGTTAEPDQRAIGKSASIKRGIVIDCGPIQSWTVPTAKRNAIEAIDSHDAVAQVDSATTQRPLEYIGGSKTIHRSQGVLAL